MSKVFNEKNNRIIVFVLYCLLILLTLIFIFNNSTASKEESTEQSNFIISWIRPILDPGHVLTDDEFFILIRKLAHFVEFGALGFEFALLAFHISRCCKLRDSIYSAFAGLLCANTDELIQIYADRGSQVSDVFIDFSGVLCGIFGGYVVAYAVRAIYRKTRKRRE